MTARSTRKICPRLGIAAEVPQNLLPSTVDVLRYWRLLNDTEWKPGLARKDLITEAASSVLNVWERASIPTINLRSIERKINHSVDYYLGMMNSVNKRDEILEKNRTDFQNNLNKLFDVGACKCRFFQTCR